jgi:O-phosphoseryl-tRNA(Cys) synthetase
VDKEIIVQLRVLTTEYEIVVDGKVIGTVENYGDDDEPNWIAYGETELLERDVRVPSWRNDDKRKYKTPQGATKAFIKEYNAMTEEDKVTSKWRITATVEVQVITGDFYTTAKAAIEEEKAGLVHTYPRRDSPVKVIKTERVVWDDDKREWIPKV